MLPTLMATAAVLHVLLLPLLCSGSDAPASLMQKIRMSPNLTKFSKLLTDTGLDVKLDSREPCSSGSCYFVFAPTDEAFARSSAADVSQLNQTLLARQHIASVNLGKNLNLSSLTEHIDLATVGKDIGQGLVWSFITEGSVLYLQARNTSDSWSFHVNNVAVNLALSQDALNGQLMVTDGLVLPLSQNLSLADLFKLPENDSLLEQLGIGRTVKIFNEWLAGNETLLSGGSVRTAFLPGNDAWSSLRPEALSAAAHSDILNAHLASGVALFPAWLPADRPAVEFATAAGAAAERRGRLVVRGAAAFVSVGGGPTAALVPGRSGLALRDAVLHTVDRVLAARYARIPDAAVALAPQFYDMCLKSEACKAALMGSLVGNPPWTLFAPLSVAGLEVLSPAERDQLLQLHFVPNEVIPKYNMSDALLVSADRDSGKIRFRSSPDFSKVWVEGRLAGRGFVRADLVAADEATQSGGLVHTVSAPLGLATLTLTDTLGQLPQLSDAAAGLQACLRRLGARPASVFVPTNRALADWLGLQGAAGAAPLLAAKNSAALSEALCSFVLPDVTDLPEDAWAAGFNASLRTLGGSGPGAAENVTLTVELAPNTTDRIMHLHWAHLQLNATAPLSAGQYQCTNGLLHVIDSLQTGGQGHRHNMGQMFVQNDAVSMATAAGSAVALLAVAAATILGRRVAAN